MSDAVHPDRAALVSKAPPSSSRSPTREEQTRTPTGSRARTSTSTRTRTRSRSRSRSPRRSPPRGPRPKTYSGLKWKKPDRSEHGGDQARDRDDRRPGHDRDRRDDRRDHRGYRARDERGHGRDSRDHHRPRDRERRDGRDGRSRRDADGPLDGRNPPAPPPPAAPPAAPASVPGEPMIMVTVNDRLGTKAQIPCFASDPVKAFKMMVAAKIGRPVHEIMLKRQGERPFHDQLSLADYGVSNGVQIDLELNTGD